MTILDPKKFLDEAYIFQKTPPPNSDYLYLLILFGSLIILALIAWFVYGHRKKIVPIYSKMQTKVFNLFFYTGLAGMALIFFRFEEIPYLGSRFFMLLSGVAFIIWTSSIIYYFSKILPKEIERFHEKKNFEKYLPRTK